MPGFSSLRIFPFSPGFTVSTPPAALNQLATALPSIALSSIATTSASSRWPWTWMSWASVSALALLVKMISARPGSAFGGASNLMSSFAPVALMSTLTGFSLVLLELFEPPPLPPQPASRPTGRTSATAMHRTPLKLIPASLARSTCRGRGPTRR
jgi:hypothetical protein